MVEEIAMLNSDYKVDMISFFDDLFGAKIDRPEAILVLLERQSSPAK